MLLFVILPLLHFNRSSDSEALSPGAEKKRGRPSRGSVPESKPIKKEKDEPSADTSVS